MAYCSNCGYSNPETAKFCNECGQKLYKADVEIQSVPAMSNLVGKTCPYCQTPFKEGADVVLCDACGMPHHKECWVANNNSCTTFGCKSVKDVLPDTEQQTETNPFFAAAEESASSDNTTRQKSKYLLPIALVVAAIAVGFAALNMTNKPSVNTIADFFAVGAPKKLSSNIPAGAGGYKWGEDIRNIPGLDKGMTIGTDKSNRVHQKDNIHKDDFKEYLPPEVKMLERRGAIFSYNYKYNGIVIGIDESQSYEPTKRFLENKYGPPQIRVRFVDGGQIFRWGWLNKETRLTLIVHRGFEKTNHKRIFTSEIKRFALLITNSEFDAYRKGTPINTEH